MKKTGLKAGVAEVAITPPMGAEMCGYGPYEKRQCTEVLDPLYARTLWLEAQGQSIVIITADVCMTDMKTHRAVTDELQARTGIPPSHVMIAASHTHSGPAVTRTIAWGEPDPVYMGTLPGLYARAALNARSAAVPARLGATRVRISDVGVNREQPAIAPLDTAAQLLRVDRADGTPLAALFNFGAHGVVRFPFTSRISADWPGLVSAALQLNLHGAPGLFLQGPCGNINGHQMTWDRTKLELEQKVADMRAGDIAWRFTNQILPALHSLQTSDSAALDARWKMVRLPCLPADRAAMQAIIKQNEAVADSMAYAQLPPLCDRANGRETAEQVQWRTARFNVDKARHQLELMRTEKKPYVVPAPVQVLKIGDAVLIGWPAEVFVELGLELRQRSPFPLTFVTTFANDTVGYIPTAAVYESKGRGNNFGVYPRDMTHFIYGRLPFRPDVGRVLIEETMEMITSL